MRKGLCNNDYYDQKLRHIPQSAWNHNRQVSISSSITSRSPSPFSVDLLAARPSLSPSPAPSYTSDATHSKANAGLKVRLVPCSFESADAFVYIPPSVTPTSSSAAPKVSNDIRDPLLGNQPLLLVGPAAKQLRQPSQKMAKGARVHPYRITPSTSTLRLRKSL
ncbi:hypothetical protein AX17_002490 [Amanita inopinata Kibby_2008]|nr:hypothetical protein AX17_002490 [Amanita inopinata Kibby_2008]